MYLCHTSKFSPPQKISRKFVLPHSGVCPPLFFSPPFWILGIFSPQFEFWHQNPLGKHQNSLKRGRERFSSPLKILEKFSPGENCPSPPFDHLLVHVCQRVLMGLYVTKKLLWLEKPSCNWFCLESQKWIIYRQNLIPQNPVALTI